MKAAQFNTYGDASVIEISSNAPNPQPSSDQVLVEVYAAGINPIDFKVRKGVIQGVPSSFPATLGGDFAGTIREPGNSHFTVGDKVYGQAGILNGGSGSIAEMAVAAIDKINLMPGDNFEDAASLPLAAVSALQAIEEMIKLQPGQKILINGGAGGIGSFAIQIAKALGAYVATTVSTDDRNLVKNLGADKVIDYKTQRVTDLLKDYDAVFDTAGPQTWDDSIMILKRGGIIISMNGEPNPELAAQQEVRSLGQNTSSSPEKLERIKTLVETGKIKPHVDKVFPLDQTREAFEYLENEDSRGKIVVKIK